MDLNYFTKILNKRKEFYSKIGKIYCHCINDFVEFNGKGFHHLRYHVNGRVRPLSEQLYKLLLFPLAIITIKHSNQIIEHKKIQATVDRKSNEKIVEFWALIYSFRGRKKQIGVKVILRRIGNGKIIFWSIMGYKNKNTP